MARLSRQEVFAPDEVAVVHVSNSVVRQCRLLGTDPRTGKNFDHRKRWMEILLERYAANFGIDLLGFAILSNQFHLILRSRPDVVATWKDAEVARRWLMLAPFRKDIEGNPFDPNEADLHRILDDAKKVKATRLRLSDIGWWVRLLCQSVAIRANQEDQESGRFWQSRFRAERILDDSTLVACTAYVDLNPIQAAITDKLETSDLTSAQLRIKSHKATLNATAASQTGRSAEKPLGSATKTSKAPADRFLAPLWLSPRQRKGGPVVNRTGERCSDKGFLPLTEEDYLQLLKWTAKQLSQETQSKTPPRCQEILDSLDLNAETWLPLVKKFGKLFYNVAGRPESIEETRSRIGQRRHYVRNETRELFAEPEQ